MRFITRVEHHRRMQPSSTWSTTLIIFGVFCVVNNVASCWQIGAQPSTGSTGQESWLISVVQFQVGKGGGTETLALQARMWPIFIAAGWVQNMEIAEPSILLAGMAFGLLLCSAIIVHLRIAKNKKLKDNDNSGGAKRDASIISQQLDVQASACAAAPVAEQLLPNPIPCTGCTSAASELPSKHAQFSPSAPRSARDFRHSFDSMFSGSEVGRMDYLCHPQVPPPSTPQTQRAGVLQLQQSEVAGAVLKQSPVYQLPGSAAAEPAGMVQGSADAAAAICLEQPACGAAQPLSPSGEVELLSSAPDMAVQSTSSVCSTHKACMAKVSLLDIPDLGQLLPAVCAASPPTSGSAHMCGGSYRRCSDSYAAFLDGDCSSSDNGTDDRDAGLLSDQEHLYGGTFPMEITKGGGAGADPVLQASLQRLRAVCNPRGLSAASYVSPLARSRMVAKVPYAEPEDLSADFLQQMNARLAELGMVAVSAAVRRGCIELVLELVPAAAAAADLCVRACTSFPPEAAAGGLGGDADAPAAAARPGAWPNPELLASLVNALGLPTPHQAAGTAHTVSHASVDNGSGSSADGGAHSTRTRIVLQSPGVDPLEAAWDAGAQQWVLVSGNRTPSALPPAAAQQQHVGSTRCRLQQVLPCILHNSGRIRRRSNDAGAADGAGSAAAQVATFSVALSGVEVQQLPKLKFLATLRGTTYTVLSEVLEQQQLEQGEQQGPPQLRLQLQPTAGAAGQQQPLPSGLLLLECWAGGMLHDTWPVPVLHDANAVSELAAHVAHMSKRASSGGSHAAASAGHQLQQAPGTCCHDLLADLGRWLEWSESTTPDPPPSSSAQGPAPSTSAAVSQQQQVQRLPGLELVAESMTSAAHRMLHYAVEHGMVAVGQLLASSLMATGRITFAQAIAQPGSSGSSSTSSAGLTLLHRAVATGSVRVLQAVLSWHPQAAVAASASAVASGKGRAAGAGADQPSWPWNGSGEGGDAKGVTPLQLAAAAGNSEVAEWLLRNVPAAAALWFEPYCGVSAADLAAVSRRGHLNMLASAAAAAPAAPAPAAGPATRAAAAAAAAGEQPAAAGSGMRQRPAAAVSAPAAGGSGSSKGASGQATVPQPAAAVPLQRRQLLLPAAEAQQLLAGGGPLPLLRMAWRGFSDPAVEGQYRQRVAVHMWSITVMWSLLMIAAHFIVVIKSSKDGDMGSAGQAVVGATGYMATVVLANLRYGTYVKYRDFLLSWGLLGRTVARALMASGICANRSCHKTVDNYIATGLDLVLDGLMQGSCELIFLPRAALNRTLDTIVLAFMYTTFGVAATLPAALARAAACNGLGFACTACVDLLERWMYVRTAARAVTDNHSAATAAAAAAAKPAKEGVETGPAGSSAQAQQQRRLGAPVAAVGKKVA